jgi:hypothetical protein
LNLTTLTRALHRDKLGIASATKPNLDEGRMWPTTFALKELTAADEARFGALVKKAAS